MEFSAIRNPAEWKRARKGQKKWRAYISFFNCVLLRQDQRCMCASLLASFWQNELLVHAFSWLIC
jgi:hypothetical protein